MQQRHLYVLLRVSKAAEIVVLALRQVVGVVGAEFRFIFIWVVQPLHAVVSQFALISTTELLFRKFAHFARICELRGRAALVLIGVEIGTVFMVMLVGHSAWLGFEEIDI